ncbi:AAA family ATPase [Chitinophaga sp. SYP-B3965]|uniref:AAA family ATPase n=1 Tax=Chitinophaga sp. SYP-B3965 TaxID=2663120 RepID=UPI0012995FCE|nr:AAA family ATPase [Chitinophaga sp. SYP-B3965]
MWTISNNKSWEQLEDQFDWVKVMKEIPQDSIHHAEGNVAIHTQMVLAELEQDIVYQSLSPEDQEILWAAALLHDVEKRSTTVTEADGRITSKGHARKGAQTARVILYHDIPTPFSIREQIFGLVKHHSLPLWLLEKRDPLKTIIMASLEVNTEWLALLARADVLGRTCHDKEDLLYRVDCFVEFCKEHGCWGTTRSFTSGHARMYYLQKDDAYPDYVPFDHPETKVVLMSGLPGAGKDTYIRKNFPALPVISLDEIRRERKTEATDKTGNGQAIQAAKEKAREYLRSKKSFVWNATNITRQMRSQLIDLFLTYKAEVQIVYVEVPYAKLHHQNSSREAVVPRAVQERLIRKMEVPALWEAHDVVYHIN